MAWNCMTLIHWCNTCPCLIKRLSRCPVEVTVIAESRSAPCLFKLFASLQLLLSHFLYLLNMHLLYVLRIVLLYIVLTVTNSELFVLYVFLWYNTNHLCLFTEFSKTTALINIFVSKHKQRQTKLIQDSPTHKQNIGWIIFAGVKRFYIFYCWELGHAHAGNFICTVVHSWRQKCLSSSFYRVNWWFA